jgi:hypothetical protein
MTVAERNKHLRIVTEVLQIHLPGVLDADQGLSRDLLSVVGVTLRAAWEDVQRSADVWDRKHYHVRADRLRDEWLWALAAANTAEGLAYREAPVTAENLERLRKLIRAPLEPSSRRVIKDLEAFRGAARANRERQRREKSRTPKRSLV